MGLSYVVHTKYKDMKTLSTSGKSEEKIYWKIADERSMVTLYSSDDNSEDDFVADWKIHYGDTNWAHVMGQIGHISKDGIRTLKSVAHIKEQLELGGAQVNIVLLYIRCAVFYVYNSTSTRIARFFVCDLNQNYFNISLCEEDRMIYTQPFQIANDNNNLGCLAKWVVDGGSFLDVRWAYLWRLQLITQHTGVG